MCSRVFQFKKKKPKPSLLSPPPSFSPSLPCHRFLSLSLGSLGPATSSIQLWRFDFPLTPNASPNLADFISYVSFESTQFSPVHPGLCQLSFLGIAISSYSLSAVTGTPPHPQPILHTAKAFQLVLRQIQSL